MLAFYLIAFLTVLPIYLLDALAIPALDSNVWNSKATIYFQDHHAVAFAWFLPFSCQFENVFIDSTSIYFIASDFASAVIDLYNCCLLHDRQWSNYECPALSSSVHFSLCYCFHDRKYVPTIATEAQLELLHNMTHNVTTTGTLGKGDHFLKGVTWLMHHWSYNKHPDHFTMKLLEFRGLMANRGLTEQCCYSSLPAKVDHLVSMDYPVYPFSDYEYFIMEVIKQSAFRQDFDFFSLAETSVDEKSLYDSSVLRKRQQLYSYCDRLEQVKSHEKSNLLSTGNTLLHSSHPKKKSNNDVNTTAFDYLTAECADQNINISIAERLPFYYSEQLVLSPQYKNNIPEPLNLTMQSFHHSVGKVLSAKHDRRNHNKTVVAILHRIDGMDFRRIINLEEVSRLAQSILKVSTVEMWHIDGKTRTTELARRFRSVNVLISPHFPRLTNFGFARSGTFVIEVQPKSSGVKTFMNLQKRAGLNYYLLKNGDLHRKNDSDMWDFTINGTELSLALRSIKDGLDRFHSRSVI
jgi:hypothetical protein